MAAKVKKVVYWSLNPTRNVIYFYCKFRICESVSVWDRRGPAESEVDTQTFGERLARLTREIFVYEGVESIKFSSHQLTVTRRQAWKPGEVFPYVMGAIRRVFGNQGIYPEFEDVIFRCKDPFALRNLPYSFKWK